MLSSRSSLRLFPSSLPRQPLQTLKQEGKSRPITPLELCSPASLSPLTNAPYLALHSSLPLHQLHHLRKALPYLLVLFFKKDIFY